MTPLVLIVDDDAELSAMLVRLLQAEGWQVQAAHTATAAELAIARQPPDVVLVDVMLPDASGLDLCRRWHATQPAIGILMLTARGDPIDRVLGLEPGADDDLPKPFEKHELVALARQPGAAVSRQQRSNAVQAGAYRPLDRPLDRTVDVQVGRLRRRPGRATAGNHWIETVRGAGHAFVARTTTAARAWR